MEPKSDLGLVSVTRSLDMQAAISQAEALKLSRPTFFQGSHLYGVERTPDTEISDFSLQCGMS